MNVPKLMLKNWPGMSPQIALNLAVASYLIPWDNKHVVLDISQPLGGGGGYDIMVDRYYQGVLLKQNGEWRCYLSEASQLTSDDVQVAIDIVDGRL